MKQSTKKIRSRKLLGQGSPGRNPPQAVEGSTDRLRVHQGTLAMIAMPQVQGKLHEALHEPWSHPRAVVWPVEAALEHEGTPRQATA